MKKTAEGVIRKLYAGTQPGNYPDFTALTRVLRKAGFKVPSPVAWKSRNSAICTHWYSRNRDQIRAFKVLDLAFARSCTRRK